MILKRKKYLVIAMDMANLAAGQVFKRIIKSLTLFAECDVICPNIDETIRQSVGIVSCPEFKRLNFRIESILDRLFGIPFADFNWSKKTFKRSVKKIENNHYDAVISFVFATNYSPMILGKMIAHDLEIPWVVYTVDAIPGPKNVMKDLNRRDRQIRQLNDILPTCDAFYAANPLMLQYEKDTFECIPERTGVLYTPYEIAKRKRKKEAHEGTVFLYTGQIYGPRNISALFEAFKQLLASDPLAKLVFVGDGVRERLKEYEELVNSGNVEIHGFTNELEGYYSQADVLLDINFDIPDFVFLSSKICNYLTIEKPIISISADGSAVRAVMKECPSIIHCHHKTDEILIAMKEAILQKDKVIDDRALLLKRFNPDSVAGFFCEELEMINNTNHN